ncbi:O-methyltransferase [Streptomyces albipurpureus]|uniref:Class I SAM-dependent methyltransferase n=1 Tax=Streptomyces albipurpureus TaxID=2897419 RepID=A0ABT0UF33_9ACTN|nr:class I SAM-dependent methyltransferase [Streptomyces sp. CWNU-1]MCM2387214.1 class I SAM-dependent methyltransferase [Streptomyces sp. CWNU-1]
MSDTAFTSAVQAATVPTIGDPLHGGGQGVATLLRQLVIATGADTVVECGARLVLPVAEALRANGRGRVVVCEAPGVRVAKAGAALEQAGLAAYGSLLNVGAGEMLTAVPGPVDLLVLGGPPARFLPVLRLLEPRMLPGAVVVADGVHEMFEPATEFLRHVRDAGNGYVSLPLALGRGLEIAVRST